MGLPIIGFIRYRVALTGHKTALLKNYKQVALTGHDLHANPQLALGRKLISVNQPLITKLTGIVRRFFSDGYIVRMAFADTRCRDPYKLRLLQCFNIFGAAVTHAGP